MEGLTEIPRLDPTDLRSLARDIVTRSVWISVGNDIDTMQWPILAMADLSKYDITKIAGVYEDIDKRLPQGVNGKPMFVSCKFLHVDDLDPLRAIVEQLEVSLR